MHIIKFLKQSRFMLILLGSVMVGAVVGWILKEKAIVLKPFGDVFLNLLFTAVVPLVFFSLSSAVAGSSNLKRLGRLSCMMLLVFALTGIISSALMIVTVKIFDPAKGLEHLRFTAPVKETMQMSDKIVETFTTSDFPALLSRNNILALIIFALMIGLASQMAGESGKPFRQFLVSANEVMQKLIGIIMYYAPIGLGAYFAYLVGVFGPKIIGSYAHTMSIYYPFTFLYFIFGNTFYAFVAAGFIGIIRFWKYIPRAALTALGTSSSLAALPVNLEAAEKIGVPEDVREIVLPIGATIHMDGSCVSAILKIALLFTLYGRSFTGIENYAIAIGVALLCGVVMSGIPGGGYIGETLIVTLYGFGPEALPLIQMIGTLVDPLATMINSSGDTSAAMIVSRLLPNKRSNIEIEQVAKVA